MSHVLIIDDSTQQFVRTVDSLQRAGMGVEVFECAISALEFARAQIPDLILTLDRLPELSVLDLLELRKFENNLQDIPVVVAGASHARKLDCYRLGCDDFVDLPVDETELVFRVCAVLRRAMRFGLSGVFSQVSFVDVVQMLLASRRDGILHISGSGIKAELVFRNGQVIFAEAGDLFGEGAFLEILRATQEGGSFVFDSDGGLDREPNIDKRTDHLLLGLASLIDEEKIK